MFFFNKDLDSVKNAYVTPKKFTPDLQIFPKCNEKDNFHKALSNVKKAYVTLRKFTPDLKIFYTDISAISVTLCNSVLDLVTFHFDFV